MFKILTILVLTGCGSSPTDFVLNKTELPIPEFYIDPTFDVIIQEYLDFMEENEVSVVENLEKLRRVEYVDSLPENIAGECQTFYITNNRKNKEYKVIRVLQDIPDYLLPALLFHELGHCLNDLTHNSIPEHIMYPSLPTHLTNWEEKKKDFMAYIKGEL